MDYDKIKERLSPCGLHCGKCFAYKNGDIVNNSKALKKDLGVDNYYEEIKGNPRY